MSKSALIVALALLAGCSSMGWRAHTIDGSSEATFERSVCLLQERLPARRRAEFEVALAVIWTRNTAVGAGDVDSDGRVDLNEVRALQRLSEDALTDVKRGVLVSAAQERGENPDSYVQQLDGLNYEDVMNLADPTNGAVFISAARQRDKLARCRGWRLLRDVYVREPVQSPLISRFCAQH